MSTESQYAFLVDSLRLAAASADDQVAALPPFVSVTDEVGTTFGSAYLLVPQLVAAKRITEISASALKRLDDYLGAMPTDGSIAPPESLATHPFWREVRRLATEALETLGEERRPPALAGTEYVRGK